MGSPLTQNFDIIIRADSFTQAAFSKTGRDLSQVRQYVKETEKSMRDLDREAQAASRGFSSSIANFAAGFASFAALGSVIRGTFEQLAEGRRLALDFEKSILDLSSVGENAKDLGKLRKEVLDLSAAMGRTPGDVAKLKFFIQSGTAGLDASTVQQIEQATLNLSKLTVADPSNLAGALIKTFQIYGDELNTVTVLQDKLFATAEKGFVEMDQLAQFITRALPAYKAFGFELNEVLGMISLGTRIGGRADEVFTQVRNIALRLPDAKEKAGIDLKGSLVEQLQQLRDVDPLTLKEIFGLDTFSFIKTITDKTAELKGEIASYGDVAGGVMQRITDRSKDATASMAEMANAMKQALQNQQTTAGASPGLANFLSLMDAAKLGSSSTAVTPDAINNIHAFLQNTLGGDAPARGFARLADMADAAGNTQLADKLIAAAMKAARPDMQFDPATMKDKIVNPVRDEETAGILAGIQQRRDAAREREAMNRDNKRIRDEINARAEQSLRMDAAASLARLAAGRSDPTTLESAAIEAAAKDPTGNTLSKLRARAERARMSGRSFDEQVSFEDSAKRLLQNLGDAIKKELESKGKDKTVATELSKAFTTLFGTQVSAMGKLLGEKAKEGTLAPALKEAAANAVAGLLGERGAAFLGVIEPDRQRQQRERRQRDMEQRIDDELEDFFGPIAREAKIKAIDDDLAAFFGKPKERPDDISSVFLSQNFRGFAERQQRGADPFLTELKEVKDNTSKSAAALQDIARGIKEGTIQFVEIDLHK